MQSGLEPRPTGGISHLTVLRNNELSMLCLPSGDLDSRDEPSAGLYFRDARHLSRFNLRLNGQRMLVLDAEEGGDRGGEVGEELPPHRDHGVVAGAGPELLPGGAVHRPVPPGPKAR